jgi:hypothetical protein
MPIETLHDLYEQVAVADQVDHPLAHPKERQLPVYVCRKPRRPLEEAWPALRRYWHGDRPPAAAGIPGRAAASDPSR